ncbi:MAG: HAD family hydrolase [Bacilli bacterium]|nr:HAD family hydrolase [Bacilli bacterium]
MKIIFSDFDKTLVDRGVNNGKIKDINLDILKKLKSNQVNFSIVSGRCLSFFKEEYPELMNVVSFFISSNGSSIYDVLESKYIYFSFIDSSDLEKIYECAKKYNLSIYFNLLDKRLYLEKGSYQYFKFNEIQCEQVVLIGNIENYEILIDNIEKIENLKISNKGKNPDNGSFFLDINRKDVSKGKAISYLCDYLEIDRNDTICFGDSDNDLSMFQVVGRGIAVENASDEIKKYADETIGTVWEDSVFSYIDNKFNQ